MTTPYLVSAHQDIRIVPLLTVPDAAPNGYRMAGVPDGIGAFVDPNGPDTHLTVLVTHELRYNQGGRRAHAASGAFVSRWVFDTSKWNDGTGCLALVDGGDLIKKIEFWDHASGRFRKGAFVPIERLCSADLPVVDALYFKDSNGQEWGTDERVFLGGEETHTKYKPEFGRAFAHVATGGEKGISYELPRLGKGSWENVLACPTPQRKTIAMLPDDATTEIGNVWQLRSPTSELYVYVGEKEQEGNVSELAGLQNGTLYGVQVYLEETGKTVRAEHNDLGFGGVHTDNQRVDQARFRLVDLGNRSLDNCSDLPGIALQKDSLAKEITQFLRLEDGAWDPRVDDYPGHFWVVTTGDVDGQWEPIKNSRLFHLVFDDISNPEAGGEIRIVATAFENGEWRFRLLDSVGIDRLGRVFVQEDPDKSNALSRTLVRDSEGEFRIVATANPNLFDAHFQGTPNLGLMTTNEEIAGIVPVDDLLGEGWFLTAVQCNDTDEAWNQIQKPEGMPDHEWAALKTDLVTPGQLLAIHIPPGIEEELPTV